MARQIAEIYNDLNLVKGNMNELSGYITETGGAAADNAKSLVINATSGSKVANWRLWLWIVAVASHVVEGLFDAAILTISAIINGVRPHTLRWYEQETRKWQYGHEIAWLNDDHYGYTVDDAEARIVSEVSASEADDGTVTLKAVKEVSGVPTALSTLEKQSLAAFWAKWKDAGVRVNIVSQSANTLNIQARVLRDRLILSEDGTLIRDSSANTLVAALQEWLDALPFNGIIRKTDIEQAAKSAEGITDFVIDFLYIADYGTTSWELIDREVVPGSGFATIDYVTSTFTYINE